MTKRRFCILLLCRHALGDIILARPVLRSLRAWRPDAWIIAGAYPEQVPWLSLHAEVDQSVMLPRRSRYGAPAGGSWPALLREVRRQVPEVVYDMTQTDRSSFVTLASGARQRIGFAQRRPVFRHRVYTDLTIWTDQDLEDLHHRDLYLKPIEEAGIPVADRSVTVDVTHAEAAGAQRRIGSLLGRRSGALVVLHPGASTESKRWPAEHFAAVCDAVQERGLGRVLLLGGPREGAWLAGVCAHMRTPAAVLNEVLSIRELAAVLQQADLFVGNDSGPTHLAAAVGTRVVALFGAASPVQWGPLGQGHVVVRPPMPCTPCPRAGDCEPPNPYHMFCVQRLGLSEVHDAVLSQLHDLTPEVRAHAGSPQ